MYIPTFYNLVMPNVALFIHYLVCCLFCRVAGILLPFLMVGKIFM